MFFSRGKKYKKKHQKRLEDQLGPSLSIISIGARVEGTLNGKNSVKISGLLEGDVTSEMLVWIAKGGRVEGTIKARGVIVEGEVNGNIDSKEKAELRSGARIIGDISCKKLSVAEDSIFDGKITRIAPSNGCATEHQVIGRPLIISRQRLKIWNTGIHFIIIFKSV